LIFLKLKIPKITDMRKLKVILAKHSGRNANGRITVRHQGGRQKRFMRVVDYRRNKREIWGKVEAIEYDPNRNADVALILYEDGERRYILAPLGLTIGQRVIASSDAPIEFGNALPLSKMPIGTLIHNIEIMPGKGGQIARGAGIAAIVQGRDATHMLVRMPSSEIRRFSVDCYATIGQVGNIEDRSIIIGKAGRSRRMGIRPTVRGTAMHPAAHPHGGGEGRSGIGMKHPKTKWGKKAVGKTRNKKRYSNKLIVQRRKPGKHAK
jgi:large subunit ribosomal protein L2